MAQEEGISYQGVAVAVVITALSVLASVYGSEALFNSFHDAGMAARERTEAVEAQKAAEARAKELARPAWVDQKKGVVRLPIDEAMKLTVDDLAKKAPAAAPGR